MREELWSAAAFDSERRRLLRTVRPNTRDLVQWLYTVCHCMAECLKVPLWNNTPESVVKHLGGKSDLMQQWFPVTAPTSIQTDLNWIIRRCDPVLLFISVVLVLLQKNLQDLPFRSSWNIRISCSAEDELPGLCCLSPPSGQTHLNVSSDLPNTYFPDVIWMQHLL